MRTLLVVYELKNKEKKYNEFYESLKSAPVWSHYIDSCWLIKTDESPENYSKKIRPFMDTMDTLLVFDITSNRHYYGWLPEDAHKWISDNI